MPPPASSWASQRIAALRAELVASAAAAAIGEPSTATAPSAAAARSRSPAASSSRPPLPPPIEELAGWYFERFPPEVKA